MIQEIEDRTDKECVCEELCLGSGSPTFRRSLQSRTKVREENQGGRYRGRGRVRDRRQEKVFNFSGKESGRSWPSSLVREDNPSMTLDEGREGRETLYEGREQREAQL